jgi:hypothetical protein
MPVCRYAEVPTCRCADMRHRHGIGHRATGVSGCQEPG